MINEYLSQTELGKLFGVSSHTIGRWLTAAGLRGPDGKPSLHGWEYVSQRPSTNPGTYFNVWHREKTVRLLESKGHALVGATT